MEFNLPAGHPTHETSTIRHNAVTHTTYHSAPSPAVGTAGYHGSSITLQARVLQFCHPHRVQTEDRCRH